MSTITMTPAFSASTPLRLTRRGKALLLATFLGLALVAMVVLGSLAVATRDAGPADSVRVVQVQPGDTLYAIAGEVSEPGHVRDMVQRIEDLNALDSASLEVGQRLAVPRR
ncbi:hypothetical protein GCM10011519_31820 [Marmoricola endophyticus]|uniref:LysM domain-containing protein n=1 Tax=Marmoricola endophyticus TaxID=2040280 RepID=A0A917BSV2_9ACTN|nr:LysM peptidoglycan-binding domain-containing protein [Marmoricola endophyticus]GGF55558.1 hypothetical protein GCM10011519_31820 [Marmoricola endophyticus]